MCVRGPDLRSVNHEMVALIDRLGFDCGQVRAVIRLRQTLAPNLFSRGDARDVALFLLLGAPLHQGWTNPRDTLEINDRRRLGPLQFLLINELLQDGRATSAIFLGPVDTHPARVVELAMPAAPPLELTLGVGVG